MRAQIYPSSLALQKTKHIFRPIAFLLLVLLLALTPLSIKLPWSALVISLSLVAVFLGTGLLHSIEILYGLRQSLSESPDHDSLGRQQALKVTHDLRSPIHSIRSSLDFLLHMRPNDPAYEDVVSILASSTNRLSDIVDDFLNSHTGDTKPTRFSVNTLLDTLLKEYVQSGRLDNINLNSHLCSEPAFVYGVPARLGRACDNMIKNAIEAMNQTGTLTVSTKIVSNHAVITINNTGSVLAPKKLRQILHGGISINKKDGHGIGMLVVKSVVAEFGGTLNAQSQEGQGTTFCLEIPLSFTD